MLYSALDVNGFGESELDYLVTIKLREIPRIKINADEI